MRTIKRYPNRKLYDTQSKKYVTLGRVADYIQRGESVQIVDNETGIDLTTQTLTQIIFDNKDLYSQYLPAKFLTGLIKLIGRPFQHLREEGPNPQIIRAALDLPLDKIAHYIDELLIQRELSQSINMSLMHLHPEGSGPDSPDLSPFTISALLQVLVDSHIPTKEDIHQIIDRLDELEAQIETFRENS